MAKQPLTSTSSLPSWLLAIQKYRGLIVPIAFVLLLVVVLVPLPPVVLDVLISLNISLSVVILLTTVYMKHPLDFSVFPSLLLATTLFRLVLNVASTRLILSADADSPEAAVDVAGKVISAFGSFVAGDSLIVGAIIFLILVVVQFVVITKGATRISEVAARFTLDAMPGKQMAIDADLNAGVIDESEARKRRALISQEADFFGAMDGASKFVRGDAIASIIITIINVLGGFAIGTLEKSWDPALTAQVFTTLTIGDGLTAQIPSFIIAIASALIVTRSGAKDQLGNELTTQIVSQPIGLIITAGFLILLAVTPLPTFPLLGSAAILGLIAFTLMRTARDKSRSHARSAASAASAKPEPPSPETLLKLDTMELEVGYGLVSLVDTAQGGQLLDKISAVRRQLAAELGFILPPVRIRDNLELRPNEYRIRIRGAVVARGHAEPTRLLAMDPGIATGAIHGTRTTEPAFGLDAWWIDPELKTRAEALNYTVVDPTTVVVTHLTEVVKQHAHELLSREEVIRLIESLKEKAPKLTEEVIPAIVRPADLQRVLQGLLRERVPIRDLESIVETLAEWAPKTKDADVLIEYVRHALRRTICQLYATPAPPAPDGSNDPQRPDRIVCITLDPAFEDRIDAYVDRSSGATTVSIPPSVATRFCTHILRSLSQLTSAGHLPIILASPRVRGIVRQLMEPHVPGIIILGYNEIVQSIELESLALVGPPAEQPVTAA